MKRFLDLRGVGLFVAVVVAVATASHANVITLTGGDASGGWTPDGTPVLAYSMGSVTESIQGVTFTGWGVPTSDAPSPPAGVTVALTSGGSPYGYSPASYAGVDANGAAMSAMITTGFYASSVLYTISGLANGTYRVDEFFYSGDADRSGTTFAINGVTTDTLVSPQGTVGVSNLIQNTVSITGGTITLGVTDSVTPTLAGFALTAVPEPSSVALLGLGAALLAWKGYRRASVRVGSSHGFIA